MGAVDVAEIYSKPRVTQRAWEYGLRPGFAVDLLTKKEDGSHWDLSEEEDVKLLEKLQAREQPRLFIGSPPCTPFSQLQAMNPKDDKAQQKWDEGVEHMKFVVQLYRNQLSAGRVFLHEHPAGAKSWGLAEVQKLGTEAGVAIYHADQCMYGLKTWGNGRAQPVAAKKPTKFMTNSQAMANQLNKRCRGDHEHQHLVGNRCAAAAFYPTPLVKAMIRGIALQSVEDRRLGCINAMPMKFGKNKLGGKDEKMGTENWRNGKKRHENTFFQVIK